MYLVSLQWLNPLELSGLLFYLLLFFTFELLVEVEM